ncbi:triosephosphate isomerase [Rhodococcus wratislaviensis]|uniref:Triosephosphate isomerase n=1 Tax=Rhodococcus wratislaviensis TaxID=44752 RepID=A0AB38FCD6_RHOWR|nr:triose-phosphate isomerase family protein [Rhodococcus wratislaviensis]REE75686.1 triosephosphate isomerase [Rhodococcus wratislaviensis]SPZ39275.1 triosephosphate isomerase [Rhodococcus wratislaviensis]
MTSRNVAERAIVGVSLKMYFGPAQTRFWLESLREIVEELHADDILDVFVLPSFLSIPTAQEVFCGSRIDYGAQDVHWEDRGAFTGEVSAADLEELGCTVTAIGHAERRRLFGEDDETTARKAEALVRRDITPIVCIGEATQESVDEAVAACRRQIDPVVAAIPDTTDLVFAYEPVWAIGAPTPASPERIVEIARRLRAVTGERGGRTRLMYGGSAGPGLYPQIADAVDGLFFGRFVHDTGNLRAAITEIVREVAGRPG